MSNVAIVLVIIVLGIVGVTAMASIDFVEAGERGVTTHWSAVDLNEEPRTQGIQFKTPFQDNIVKFDIQTQKYPSIPTGIEGDAGDNSQKGIRIASTSRDIQDVFTEIVVIYHLNGDTVNTLYSNVGIDYESKVIQPILKQVAKQTMAKFSAEELVTQREPLKNQILNELSNELANLDQCKNCIYVEDIALTDIDFTEVFAKSIEAKVTATQKALEAENDKVRIQFEADQVVISSQGKADAKAIEAKGEAQYIATINKAIQDNPDFLSWYKIARWSGDLPLVVGEGSIPLVNIPMTNTVD